MNTQNSKVYVNEPKQDRSRESLERLLKAACDLLVEKGYSEFTLQEVSKRANVSIGSIYNRFKNKENLIRQLHERELSRMEIDSAVLITKIRRKELKLRQMVPEVITQYANLLRKYRGILKPLMEISAVDEAVALHGKKHATENIKDFTQLLLECKSEIIQPNAERSVNSIFRFVYSSLARFLGLGIMDSVSGEGDWEELLEDLSQISLHYLLGHPDEIKN